MTVFKAYDIRGIYGKEWTAETAYLVGRCIPVQLDAKRVLVARDARVSSPEIRDALVRGLTEAGADVDDMGLSTTPMVYFFTARNGYDASVQVTASHNPAEYNGLKISKRDALPVGYDAGLKEIAARIQKGRIPQPAATPGTVRQINLLPEFIDWLRTQKPDLSGLRFAVDCSDGMAGLFARQLFGEAPLYLNDIPDGTFPHHDPNPLNPESCRQIIAAVKEGGLDIGVIFDGDADRVMFIDEKGTFVQPDFLIPLIASHFIPNEKEPVVIHDIRTSRGAIEELHRLGARTVMGKVGHAYAKIALRTERAVCGGELAGHYYFRDFYHCDSAEWAALIVLGAVAQAKREGKTFSDLLAPVRIYANSGEMNHRIENKTAMIEALRKAFIQHEGEPMAAFDFDGIRLEWPKGWINVRASNTEPCLRLLMETHTPEELAEWKNLALSVINQELPDHA